LIDLKKLSKLSDFFNLNEKVRRYLKTNGFLYSKGIWRNLES